MKKMITILLSFLMVICLAACGNSADQTERSSAENSPAEAEGSVSDDGQTEDSAEDVVQTGNGDMQTADDGADGTENAAANEAENAGASETQLEDTDLSEEQGNRILVVYFSATNTTKGIAEHIANGLNADIYEIVPEEPYTDADLDYHDSDSRSTAEMNDPNARPAISGSVENMDQYTTVFVGYPIWWGEAPKIISTFIESYDFSGKTIVPFCTSGSSGIGSSAANLEQLTGGAEWLEGRRLDGSDTQDEVMEWVNSLDLTK